MLIKKKNPEWKPSENPEMAVGDTIEMTDPKALILAGDAIGMAADGVTELTAFELYGVLIEDEQKGYQEFLQMKKAQATKAALQIEQKELEEKLEASKPAPEPVKVEEKVEEVKEEIPAVEEVKAVETVVAKPAVEVKGKAK